MYSQRTESRPSETASPRNDEAALRIDDAQGNPVGVVLVLDSLCERVPLDVIERSTPDIVTELVRLQQTGDGRTKFVIVDERGVHVKARLFK